MAGPSRRAEQSLRVRLSVSQKLPLEVNRPDTAEVPRSGRSPEVNLVASGMKKAMASTTIGQAGHLLATRSNSSLK